MKSHYQRRITHIECLLIVEDRRAFVVYWSNTLEAKSFFLRYIHIVNSQCVQKYWLNTLKHGSVCLEIKLYSYPFHKKKFVSYLNSKCFSSKRENRHYHRRTLWMNSSIEFEYQQIRRIAYSALCSSIINERYSSPIEWDFFWVKFLLCVGVILKRN